MSSLSLIRFLQASATLCYTFHLTSCSDPSSTGAADEANPEAEPESEIAVVFSPGQISAQPLAARSSGSAGEKQFHLLTTGESGVDFVNRIETDHPLKHLYATEKVCGGIAVGDLNGDDQPDLFFTNGPSQNRLFLQTGNLQFADATSAAGVDGGGRWSAGAALVDIDGDGDLDIYVANYAAPNQLFLNRGDATFEERAQDFGLAYVSASHMPTFCDYDRDGDLDLYLLTNRFHSSSGKPKSEDVLRFEIVDGVGRIRFDPPEVGQYFRPYQADTREDGKPIFKIQKVGQPDVLFRNDGGRFTDVSREAGIGGTGFGLSATWWDFNQDGWPDLWVGNDFDDPDRVYRNNGDGTFTDVVKTIAPHITWFSMGADFADLNGDARPDFLIADMSGTNHFKQKTNMGSMGAKAEFLRTADPQQYMRNALFLNTGTERFMEGAFITGLANSDWTWTVKLSDLNCDGLPDVFFTNGMSKNFNESDNAAVLAQPGESEWDRHVRAGTQELREQNIAFKNLGNLEFEDVSRAWGLDHVGMSFGSAHADLDRDGDLDLIVCNLEEPAGIYRNDFEGGNRLLIRLEGASPNRFGVGARLELQSSDGTTQIRELTPVRGYLSSNEPLVHFGLGNALPERLIIAWPSGHRQEITEVKANHFYRIAEPAGAVPPRPKAEAPAPLFKPSSLLAEAIHKENEHDDFATQLLLPNQMSRLGPGQAWGDLDGDGSEELWLAGPAGSPGQIWKKKEGTFIPVTSPALAADAAHEDMGGLWFDADSDGDMDLYVVSGGYEFPPGDPLLADRLYLNVEGQLSRSPADALPEMLVSGSTVNGADFDRDGDLDLFVGGRQVPGDYPAPARSILLVNEGGKLTPGDFSLEGLVTSALWSDLDRDGWIDLLVTLEWGPVRVFQNREGRMVEVTGEAGTGALTGWWNGISGRDLDGDGDLDYVVTNFGLNTKYHASQEHPALLYYGDFGTPGENRIVEAEFEDDVLYPGRGRSCSSNAMPHLRESFTTFRDFAAAELVEIYPKEKLKGAIKLAATTLESGVFLNETPQGGACKLTFLPLPRLAQIAPAFGAVLTDVDADGVPDLYLAQNFHSPQVETGHMAGGVSQLLRGRGDGTFEVVPPHQSGLVVGGDAASLTLADLDDSGSVDFVVGLNDGALQTFTRQAKTKALAVRLIGRGGNPTAVGARVTLVCGDGTEQVAEISAGGSYLSQSPAVVFFNVPSGQEVKELQVRWPDGRETTHGVSSTEGTLEIAKGD